MVTYRFLGFSRSGTCVAGQFARCENVIQARERAREMLDRGTIQRVEVWDDGRKVSEVIKRGRPRRSPT
jgi:hypothetical protein